MLTQMTRLRNLMRPNVLPFVTAVWVILVIPSAATSSEDGVSISSGSIHPDNNTVLRSPETQLHFSANAELRTAEVSFSNTPSPISGDWGSQMISDINKNDSAVSDHPGTYTEILTGKLSDHLRPLNLEPAMILDHASAVSDKQDNEGKLNTFDTNLEQSQQKKINNLSGNTQRGM